MKSRERLLIVLTVLAVVIGGFFQFFYDDLASALSTSSGGKLATEQTLFKSNAKVIANGSKIREDYDKMTLRNVPESRGRERPGNTFMDELSRILKEEFNQPTPTVEPYQMSPVPKMDDYYFVDVNVSLSGETDVLLRLLTQMEQRGLLIKDFTLAQVGGRRHSATLKVQVSRLVQHDDISRGQFRALRKFGH